MEIIIYKNVVIKVLASIKLKDAQLLEEEKKIERQSSCCLNKEESINRFIHPSA